MSSDIIIIIIIIIIFIFIFKCLQIPSLWETNFQTISVEFPKSSVVKLLHTYEELFNFYSLSASIRSSLIWSLSYTQNTLHIILFI